MFENRKINALLDTGASCSLIDIGSLQMLGLGHKIITTEHKLVDASGREMNIIGSVMVTINLGGILIKQNLKVLNAKTYKHVLLGRDFLSNFGTIEFDIVANRVKLGKKWFICVSSKAKEPVRVQNNVSLPPRSESIVNVKCSNSLSLITADFEPKPLGGVMGVYATRCRVIPDLDRVFQISLLNVNNDEVTVNSRKFIGNLTMVNETVSKIDSQEDENLSIPQSSVNHGNNISDDEKDQLRALISKYGGIFASNPRKPTPVRNMTHRIITNDAQPVRMKPYRIPHAWDKEVSDQVQQMLDNGIIRPSSSPWNAPVILVKKKDDSMRFVCDFRGLNDVTKKDSYPLPHIRDVIDRMEGAQFWTTLDAASAYWSMPVAEEDKEKTAFSVPRGKFEFNVTPFGLCNAGASYQRMMDITLSGLPSDRVLAYMDDIVIFSGNFQEHLHNLEQVFQRLQSSGISLKLSKCVFACNKVNFLGFELSKGGIKPQARLTEAIDNYKRPETRKELKGFLGLAGFYRSFIQNFAEICQPLNKLTSENVPFQWDDSCEIAFSVLKQKLSSKPVLSFPKLGEPFIVEVDASNHAVGGVLSQVGNDDCLHPVAYFSTALQPSQKNWSATTKEAFALVSAVRHWQVYLAGTTFVLNSDHNPLTHLREQKDPRGKFARWLAELEEFDYSVQYIPGKFNIKADALSRNKAASDIQPPTEFEENIYALFGNKEGFRVQLKEEQSKDPLISDATICVLNGEKISKGKLKRVQLQLRVCDSILTKSGRPIIPPSLRKLIVTEYHNIAHFGTDKVYSLLKDRYYWPSMYNYIKLFSQGCETCQKTKCTTSPPKAPLVPMFIPNAPMQFLSIDIAYLPKDNNGYQYLLLIGDIFSKFVQAVPLKDQTAPKIVDALLRNWIYIHGSPFYLLSDQGSNVDGEVMAEICNELGIEKRRSSAYHSQGNGFAERNIRTVKDLLRSVLLHRRLQQSKWRSILPGLVFALNASESKATRCVPYNVVFGRAAILPQDVAFDNSAPDQRGEVLPAEFEYATSSSMKDIFSQVVETLEISKRKMQQQYNRNLRFIDYSEGQQVWLKVKHYKTGENRKLAPRRDGPWKIISKLPNGVNFQIENSRKERKIVHHDRLLPVVDNGFRNEPIPNPTSDAESNSSESDVSEDSDYSYSDSDSGADDHVENGDLIRERPRRQRQQRYLPDTIPWGALRV